MWMKNIEQHTAESVSKILLGNKCDDEERRARGAFMTLLGAYRAMQTVAPSRGEALAKEFGIPFIETSAKEPRNVDEAFFTIARAIKTRLQEGGTVPTLTGPQPEKTPSGSTRDVSPSTSASPVLSSPVPAPNHNTVQLGSKAPEKKKNGTCSV